jgi:hypothetical protein
VKLRPVRLCDVPLEVRLRAARAVCRVEPDPQERIAVFSAAGWPSAKTYWVTAA